MIGGSKDQWNRLLTRTVTGMAKPSERDLILGILRPAFHIPAGKAGESKATVTEDQLAAIVLEASIGKTDSLKAVCKANGISPRTFWRYFQPMALPDFANQVRLILHRIFQLARRRFGLFRRFEVYIDETQTLVFGRVRRMGKRADGKDIAVVSIDDAELTEIGLLAGGSKNDKYAGKFHALTYQVMVAKCRRSGIIVPLDIVLVATEHPLLVDDLEVPGRSREWIIDHFMGLLEALYPPASLILFDRGYHARINYARVTRYCRDRNALYMTPVVDEGASDIQDATGRKYSRMRDFILKNRVNAVPLGRGSSTLYWVARRPVRRDTATVRTVIVFYRLRKAKGGKDEDNPAVVVEVDADYVGCAFYVNHPDPAPLIQWFERAYSRRWGEENWFKKRGANCHDGRAHQADRRLLIFITGCLALTIYALMRGIQYPVHDVVKISRDYAFPDFILGLLKQLHTG